MRSFLLVFPLFLRLVSSRFVRKLNSDVSDVSHVFRDRGLFFDGPPKRQRQIELGKYILFNSMTFLPCEKFVRYRKQLSSMVAWWLHVCCCLMVVAIVFVMVCNVKFSAQQVFFFSSTKVSGTDNRKRRWCLQFLTR